MRAQPGRGLMVLMQGLQMPEEQRAFHRCLGMKRSGLQGRISNKGCVLLSI